MASGSPQNTGILLVSLDFELAWGIHDTLSIADYRGNLLGERRVVPALLGLFDEYGVHATWATVGLLFFRTREELIEALPVERPSYANTRLSPYPLMETLGADEGEAPLHYAASLIELVRSHPNQEIGSHTFSHYYCLEQGQTSASFKADLRAAISVARTRGISLESLVFPKNQFNPEYVSICRELGIRAFRGNPPSWLYRPLQTPLGKAARLLDAYLNISGHNCYPIDGIVRTLPLDLPASRFLRPYLHRLRTLERLRMRRILSDLTHAARTGQVYHLWWHPHNFGADTDTNLVFLRRVLDHFARLRDSLGMESLNMGELSRRIMPDDCGAEVV
jgi:hypothetical protein